MFAIYGTHFQIKPHTIIKNNKYINHHSLNIVLKNSTSIIIFLNYKIKNIIIFLLKYNIYIFLKVKLKIFLKLLKILNLYLFYILYLIV